MASIIILNHNGQTYLGKILEGCLESVFNTNYENFEVIFVDNASTDGSVALVKKKFAAKKELRVIQNEENLGFSEGNNVGIRNARGEYVVLLNNDTKVDPDWIGELVKAIQPSEIGAAQCKILLLNNPKLMDCAGGFVDYYGYHHYEIGYKEEAEKYNSVYEIFYAKGAGMMIKKNVLRNAGLFDPEIFMYYDETDLCWRIRLNGFKVIFVPKSLVYHLGGATASSFQERMRVYFSTRNHLLMILKNFDARNMLKVFVVSLIWEFRNVGKFVLKGNLEFILATVEGLLWNLFKLRSTWEKRQIAQNFVRKVSDKSIRRIMLKPYPPFPLSLIFSKARYLKRYV